ncbi:hypothetical protein [Nostoc sp. MG11]|uniref:hypothetical protein n=1 Tax=Nostoc sp. MG11 TaxID=2721166 RepID=UPI0018662E5C|nr:hypothetical protein [Nostoc sp. MG11]
MVRQSGLLPRGDAKGDGGFHASCYPTGTLRANKSAEPPSALAPHEELPLAQR